MEIIKTDSGRDFTSKEFLEDLSIRGVQFALKVPDHKEINEIFDVTWQTLQTISH